MWSNRHCHRHSPCSPIDSCLDIEWSHSNLHSYIKYIQLNWILKSSMIKSGCRPHVALLHFSPVYQDEVKDYLRDCQSHQQKVSHSICRKDPKWEAVRCCLADFWCCICLSFAHHLYIMHQCNRNEVWIVTSAVFISALKIWITIVGSASVIASLCRETTALSFAPF